MKKPVVQFWGLMMITLFIFSAPVFADNVDEHEIPLPLLEKIEVISETENLQVNMHFNQEIEYSSSITTNPMRIIVDIKGGWYRNLFTQITKEDWLLNNVRVFHNHNGLRVVVELNYEGPHNELYWDRENKTLKLSINRRFTKMESIQLAKNVKFHSVRRGIPSGTITAQVLDLKITPYTEGRKILEEIGKPYPYHDVRLKVAFKKDTLQGLSKISDLVRQEQALAGINGGFFGVDGYPLGLLIQDGKLVSGPLYGRTAWGIDRDGFMRIENVSLKSEIVINDTKYSLTGFNRVRGANEMVVYLPTYGRGTNTNQWGLEAIVQGGVVTAINTGNSPIPRDGWVLSAHGQMRSVIANLKVGDEIQLILHTEPDWIGQGIIQAIGGGPRLVQSGQIKITGIEESFRSDILKGRAPRTALGITKDNHLLFVTVDGRSENSAGMTLQELAEFMLYLGARDAMNLDGGKSSTMIIREKIFNSPSSGSEIKVHNGLLIFAEPLKVD